MAKKVEEEIQKTADEEVREKLSELLNGSDFGTTVVIFTHKDCSEPQVWRKGHWYDSTVLMAEVLKAYKLKAANELDLA